MEAPRKKQKLLDAISGDYLRSVDSKGGFLLPEETVQNDGDSTNAKPDAPMTSTWDPLVNLDVAQNPKCRECQSLDIEHVYNKHFKVLVCKECKERLPEKYSLLTKTECREDYLLTQSELQDNSALPFWMKPNPHKSTWSDMYLYLRCQVEEFAWKKWGSPGALDAEFNRREAEKKQKKEKKYATKMLELRKRTRTSTTLKAREYHSHEYGEKEYDDQKDLHYQKCKTCGLIIEFDEF